MKLMIAAILMALGGCVPAHCVTLNDQVAAMTPGDWAVVQVENTAASIDPSRFPETNAKCAAANKPAPCTGVVPYYSGSASDMRAMFGAWNGGAYATGIGPCGTMVYLGGGHTDWYGNQVIGLDLCGGANGPIWRMLSAPFNPSSAASAMMDASGSFPDGTISPSHNRGGVAELGGAVFVSTSQSNRAEGALPSGLPEYAPDAWVWDVAWHGPFPHAGARDGSAAADTLRNVFWFQPDTSANRPGEFSSFNPATGVVTGYGRPNSGGSEQMMGYDPDADRLVVFSLISGARNICEKNPANPTAPCVVATQIGKPTLAADFGGGHATSWSPRLHAWIVFMGTPNDARVWKIQRTAPLQYTWTLLSIPGATPPVVATQNGLFGKMQVVPTDNGEVMIGAYSLTSGAWAFRIPGTELSRLPCSADGMFVCESLAVAPTSGKMIAGYAGNKPVVKDGALVFTIPSGSGPDAGGRFELTKFPATRSVAIAFSVRADKAMTTLDAPGWKNFTLYSGNSPCTARELTQSHDVASINRPRLSVYTNCGRTGLDVPVPGSTYDKRYHQAYYDCHYLKTRVGDLTGCAQTKPDVWQDFYFEIVLGEDGTPTSRVHAWERTPGQPWRQYIARDDFQFPGAGGFDHFMLTIYMTGKKVGVAHAPGEVRYRRLMLSTKPFFDALQG